MKKQVTRQSLHQEKLEQLNFDQAEQEVRELFEQENLPTSSELEKYNVLVPNGAERILNLIEEERIHRREMELKQLQGRNTTNNLMVIFGFIFGFFMLIFIGSSPNMSGIGYLIVWATMVVILGLIFAPYIKSRLGNR